MIAQTVAELRKRRGVTQAQLAAESGLDQTTISAIERGDTTNPTVMTLSALAVALGVAVADLLADPEPAERSTP